MRLNAVLALLLTCPLTLGGAVLAPAHAGSAKVTDGEKDAWTYVAAQDPGPYPAPEFVTNVDVLASTVSYNRKRLVVSLRYVDLAQQDGAQLYPTWRIRTGDGPEYRATVHTEASTGLWSGQATLDKGDTRLQNCRFKPFVKEDKGLIGVRIARKCLDGEAWVEVAAASNWCIHCEDKTYDFAGNPGGKKWTWSKKVRRS